MSTTPTSNETVTRIPGAATADLKLEVVAIPVSDIDRAKHFYESLGWKLDADFWIGKNFRAVQLTPPGSQCSIIWTQPPRRALLRACSSSSPTSRQRAASSSLTASM